jgi:hypothetical protein
MKNLAAPSTWAAFEQLFLDGSAREGACIIVPVLRDEAGSYLLGEKVKAPDCTRAIHSAGEMSSREPGVLVVAYFEGAPLVLARYGDTPPDLI